MYTSLTGWWLSPSRLKNDGQISWDAMKFPTVSGKSEKIHGSKPPASTLMDSINNVLLVKIEGPVLYTIYHHLPVVKGVNKPLY